MNMSTEEMPTTNKKFKKWKRVRRNPQRLNIKIKKIKKVKSTILRHI